ncbi:hypothetical protein [Spirillospora sp. CA-294931]|uniref:hypothetical protein n=1 Tax=Spirillospora sp. CA-294931 TaxID=3240042 RepID=UPI003D8A2BF8
MPAHDVASSWLRVEGTALSRIWSEASPRLTPLAPLPCRLTDDGTEHQIPLWLAHADRPYQGEPAELVVVTALAVGAETLRTARGVQCLDLSVGAARDWEDIGVLDKPLQTPPWLLEAMAGRIWRPSPFAARVEFSWPTPVATCMVKGDARTLRLEGTMGWGEVLAEVRCVENDSSVEVLVHVGIDPDLPRLPRGGARGRPAVKRRWRAEVRLGAELASRSVIDLADDENARSRAVRSWRQWRQDHRPSADP